MLTYNNDIFKDGNMAAYQVWARAQVNVGVKPVNSAINSAMAGMDFCSLCKALCYMLIVVF
jgi:hypothetical protein